MDSSSSACLNTDAEVESHNDLTEMHPTHLENLSGRHKVAVLVQIFPGIRPSELKRVLNKCNGKAVLAIDVLLDQVFRDDSCLRYQRVKTITERKLHPHPGDGTGSKGPVAVPRGPRRFHQKTMKFRGNRRAMFGTDKSLRPPVNHKKVAAKGVIRKVLVKPSNNKNGRPVVDSPKTLDQTSTRKSQDRGKTKSIRQSKGKNEGKDDGKGTRRL